MFTPETGQVLDDDRCYFSGFDQCLHFPKAGAIKGRAADSVVYKVLWVQISVLLGVIHQNDLLVLNTVTLSVQTIVL